MALRVGDDLTLLCLRRIRGIISINPLSTFQEGEGLVEKSSR